MLFFVGEPRGKKDLGFVREMGWGRMVISGNVPIMLPSDLWGFDNGAFGYYKRGEAFDNDTYCRRLEKVQRFTTKPILAVVPDVVGDGARSLEFSLHWYERLRAIPFPWLLAVQDGMEEGVVESLLPQFAGLFLGGSTAFKGTAPAWAGMCRRQGKWFHFGRCGTPRRLAFARACGADSADSAFPFWCSFTERGNGRSSNLHRFILDWQAGRAPQRSFDEEWL